MSKKPFSSSMFWARQLGLAAALIIIAVVVIQLQKHQKSEPIPQGQTVKKDPAKGLSSFYAEYRTSSGEPNPEEQSDFVMPLSEQDTPLNDRLQAMESVQKPASGRWVGEHKYRTFKAGGTLREIISNYAQSEGMQVIWELNQDFVVKNNFQVDDTVVGTLNKIARAVDSNFSGTVEGFFCPKQRTLVITDKPTDYLRQFCSPTDAAISAEVERATSMK
ncbi:TcpQ domain-containing protein [Bowmanella sp. Y26]|uniref:TcpQ domain-containing protein n=1 Tax=Bowmanella yangjiangensis TaxID=2811230 RepID=UPI001BDBE191|nr:TcpQ domain-containing protein [Bowmanella yangjiangensis]MBT1064818.1 TcpQ domain-containing protein [Bowmanella yangjiangensis]